VGAGEWLTETQKARWGSAYVALAISVLLRLRLPRELHGRASLWISCEEEGAGRSYPAAWKWGFCAPHPSLRMLSGLIYLDPR
jgi:hypothetical protein